MIFTDDFKKIIQDQIYQFLNDTNSLYHMIENPDSSLLTEHLPDYNIGYGIGYVEGILITRFVTNYSRLMNPKETMELKILMYKFGLQLKMMIDEKTIEMKSICNKMKLKN